MRRNELTTEQQEKALVRYERVDEILADFDRQNKFALPQRWRTTMGRLILQGLGDPEIHLIYDTIMCIEYEAGRLEATPVDYAEITKDW